MNRFFLDLPARQQPAWKFINFHLNAFFVLSNETSRLRGTFSDLIINSVKSSLAIIDLWISAELFYLILCRYNIWFTFLAGFIGCSRNVAAECYVSPRKHDIFQLLTVQCSFQWDVTQTML